MYCMAGVGMSTNRVEYGNEEAVVTKARSRIVYVEVQITTNRKESKAQNKYVDEYDGENAKISSAQLGTPEKRKNNHEKGHDCWCYHKNTADNGMQTIKLTGLQQIQPTGKNQHSAKTV